MFSGFFGQPAAIFHGGVMGDSQGGIIVVSVGESLVGIGGSRAGDGVTELFRLFADVGPGWRLALGETLGPVPIVFVPLHFELAHPEGLDGDRVLRPLVGSAALFLLRAAHHECAAGNRHHLEGDLVVDLFLVRFVFGLLNLGIFASRLAGHGPAYQEECQAHRRHQRKGKIMSHGRSSKIGPNEYDFYRNVYRE